jgi:D-alanyl-D-alanine carboxypeptidase
MLNRSLILIYCLAALIAPTFALALDMPQSGNDLAAAKGIGARSYIVSDAAGQVLISKNADQQWPPASLTKLITALVVLDTKPKLATTVIMTQSDQAAGDCLHGGACIRSAAGVKFTVDGLFHALLMPSANNAANALARSTGLSAKEFVNRMNDKAKVLGAFNTRFNEPAGMDPGNKTTASDYAKIVQAAFGNFYLTKIAKLNKYYLRSVNNSKYSQVINNTDKLVSDADVKILGAKTGYLDESQYNLASLLDYKGQRLAVVVMGEPHLYSAFAETKTLAGLAEDAKALLSWSGLGAVLAASSTTNSLNN